jgi:hypothetical protein
VSRPSSGSRSEYSVPVHHLLSKTRPKRSGSPVSAALAPTSISHFSTTLIYSLPLLLGIDADLINPGASSPEVYDLQNNPSNQPPLNSTRPYF